MGLLSQQPFFKKVNSVVNASILIYKINGDARLAPVVFAKGTHQTAAYSRERIVLSAKIPNTLQSRSLFVAARQRVKRGERDSGASASKTAMG